MGKGGWRKGGEGGWRMEEGKQDGGMEIRR